MDKCPDGKCQAQKVSWKSLGLTVLALMSILTTVVLFAMAGERKQNDKIAEIPVIQKDIEHIKGNIKTINSAVEDIRKEMRKQINKDDLNRLIEAVKNGK